MRRRPVYLAALALVVAAGLGSRSADARLPRLVAAYGGDTLWALAAFLVIGLVFAAWSTARVAAAAGLLACAVECSQFYHAPWIDRLRATRLGALLIGHEFLWSDLVCYAVGVAIGVLLEVLVLERFALIQQGEGR